ncbi:RES family NAD+ phosphorylase [Edaphobacter aggregans]|uniref:RES family NAD+ phosphorylase n=1 Tax=Edaphobacter aggregans TaxID=570835 RepID=UPI0005596D5A|nr:RES family NAD+ phosphorylase [Edaphobacter aggregans]
MRTLWRISRHSDLEGLGGEKTEGRWHTAGRGKRIVYLAEHPALALVEVLVNLRGTPEFFPESYRLMKIHVADGTSTDAVAPENLNPSWREDSKSTQMLGDAWLEGSYSALLAVPSAPSPESTNYLLNPRHSDASRVTVEWSRWIAYDQRLFRVRK